MVKKKEGVVQKVTNHYESKKRHFIKGKKNDSESCKDLNDGISKNGRKMKTMLLRTAVSKTILKD